MMRIYEYSEDTITVYLDKKDDENNERLIYLIETLKEMKISGIVDFSLSYASLVIYYNQKEIDDLKIKRVLENIDSSYTSSLTQLKRIVEIPVCYDPEFGLDQHRYYKKGISHEDIISLHTEKEYLIYMVGFLPGFPYLNGVHNKLRLTRLSTPRTSLPEGSVGIAETQTGFYPTASPGGWNIIGRTPLKIGIDNNELHVPYQAGDYIKFVPISKKEFYNIQELIAEDNYKINTYERGV